MIGISIVANDSVVPWQGRLLEGGAKLRELNELLRSFGGPTKKN